VPFLRDRSANFAFPNFVETTGSKILPPAHASWKNPFCGNKGRVAKLDFAILYHMDDEVEEGYMDERESASKREKFYYCVCFW
jgi:hypothetical protein